MLMAIDFITGVLVAAVFRNSNKTKTGAYDSTKGFVGIAKKVFIILLLVALHFVDRVMGAGGLALKLGTVGFMINEFMSIMENAGLMGIKLPKAFSNALDVLKSKEDDEK